MSDENKVVQLVPSVKGPVSTVDPSTVSLLKHLLEMAEKGELLSIAVAGDTGGGIISAHSTGAMNISTLVCGLESTKLSLFGIKVS